MKRALLLGTVLSLAPATLLAQQGQSSMSYTAFEINYLLDVEPEDTNVDGDGWELAGSYELTEDFFLLGDWQDLSLDFGIDGELLEIGGGWHTDLSETIDFVATISYVDSELNFGNASADDDGLALGGGIRAQVGNDFQVDLGLKWVDFDDAGSDTGLFVGGRWYFADNLAITGRADLNDNADVISIGFRAEF